MDNFIFDFDNNVVDEDFFGSLNSQKSSRLQQLFSSDVLSADEKQQSLKYQRPKVSDFNNRDEDLASNTNLTSITLMAKVVTAYKEGKCQGKVGLALIQNADNTCAIIMYKTKDYILVSMKLLPEQHLLYKQAKYWQFYDDESIYWSFSFVNEEDEEEFKEKLNIKNLIYKEKEENEVTLQTELEKPIFNNLEDGLSIQITEDSAKESKNSLIKRMAKMGKPLPTLTSSNQQTTTEFSDSSDTEVIKTPLSIQQKPSIVPRSSKTSTMKVNHQLVPIDGTYNSTTLTAGSIYPINPLESQYMQMLLTEQRTQGSELRMNMNKLESKIEKVLDKLELYDKHDSKHIPKKDDEILELEEKLLTLKKENRKLKKDLEEKSENTLEENNVKSIIHEFRKDLEDLNINPKLDLKCILQQLVDKIKESRTIKNETERNLNESELKVKEIQNDLFSLKAQNMELANQLKLSKDQQKIVEKNLNIKENEIFEQKGKIDALHKKLQEKSEESSKSSADILVKSIMNNLYLEISEKLENLNIPQQEQILSLIAVSIRQETLKSLQQSNGKET